MFGRWLAATITTALVAAACSTGSTPLTVEEYAAALQAVESGFESEAPDPLGRPEDRHQYPLGGDLVVANDLYMQFHERLVGWRGISPPTEMNELHGRMVDALEAVQQEVGRYLGEQAMSEAVFDFDSIGPAVGPFLRDASQACVELRSALNDAGAEVEFAAPATSESSPVTPTRPQSVADTCGKGAVPSSWFRTPMSADGIGSFGSDYDAIVDGSFSETPATLEFPFLAGHFGHAARVLVV